MKVSNPPSEVFSLLAEMRSAGLTIAVDGGRLRVGPAGLLTDELRASIREHRAGLISILAAETAPAVESATDPTPAEKIDSRPVSGPAMGTVHCRDCQHFVPDTINPPEGVGLCGVTGAGPPSGGSGYKACYPMAPRRCPSYQKEQNHDPE
jgi:hypothetical protein